MLGIILDNLYEAQTVFIVAMVFFAWRVGAGPERAVAFTFGGMKIVHDGYLALSDAKFALLDTDIMMASLDLVVCIIFVTIGLQANRMYTLWIAAFQIIALNAHIVREISTGISPLAYAIMYIAPSHFQLLILAGGIWCHSRRERRFGPYRSWRYAPAGTKLA